MGRSISREKGWRNCSTNEWGGFGMVWGFGQKWLGMSEGRKGSC